MHISALDAPTGSHTDRTRVARSIGLLLAATLLSSGCATPGARSASASAGDERRAVRAELASLRAAVEQMRADRDRLAAELGRAVKQQTQQDARIDSLRAELAGLSTAVNDATGRVEAVGRRADDDAAKAHAEQRAVADSIDTLEHRLTELKQSAAALDARVASLGQGVARGPSVTPIDRPRRTAPAAVDRANPATPSAAKEIYDAAYLDFSRGSYSLAIGGFGELLRRFPETPQADDAQYWLGESHWALARWYENKGQAEHAADERRQAVADLTKLVEQHPRSDKAPTALYREALILGELGETEQARERLQRLLDSFPQAAESRLAREKLAPKNE